MRAKDLLPSVPEAKMFGPAAALSWEAAEYLSKVLVMRRPRRILEIGPGMSTFIFRRYQRLDPQVEHHAIDHIGPWHKTFVESLQTFGYGTGELFAIGETPDKGYDLTGLQLPDDRPYDLVFCDGPWDGAARRRLDLLEFVVSRTSPLSAVVIDDAARPSAYAQRRQLFERYDYAHFNEVVIRDRQSWGHLRETAFLLPRAERAELDVHVQSRNPQTERSLRCNLGVSTGRPYYRPAGHSPFGLTVQGEWELVRALDVTPYLYFLHRHREFRFVRLMHAVDDDYSGNIRCLPDEDYLDEYVGELPESLFIEHRDAVAHRQAIIANPHVWRRIPVELRRSL